MPSSEADGACVGGGDEGSGEGEEAAEPCVVEEEHAAEAPVVEAEHAFAVAEHGYPVRPIP